MEKLFTWTCSPDPDPMSHTQVIIGMSFGANRKDRAEDPGRSNEAIARIIFQLRKGTNIPIIVQREVSEAIEKLQLPIAPALVISEGNGEFHITSRDVLLRTWEHCEPRGLKRAVIVAHPAHILRCSWAGKKIGFSVKIPEVLDVPYEPRSRQWWTRNKVSYALWEVCARIGWIIKGHI